MRIVKMNGGLGNQSFQYIFLRYIEENSGETCIIDDLSFLGEHLQHNGYELEKIFSIRHPRLSDSFDPDVIAEMRRLLGMSKVPGQKPENIISVFRACGIDLLPVQEGNTFLDANDYQGPIFSAPLNEFYPDILRCSGNLYYYGYWINGHWFGSILDKMVQEFHFPALPDAKNRSYMSEIQGAGERSVAVHIRRGDFLDLGLATSPEWYQAAIVKFREYIVNPVFFMFSDDIPWVKENRVEMGLLPNDKVIFVEGNMGGNNYIDMQLMAACRGMVIANSSFSYLAALLNRRPDRLVAHPAAREVI